MTWKTAYDTANLQPLSRRRLLIRIIIFYDAENRDTGYITFHIINCYDTANRQPLSRHSLPIGIINSFDTANPATGVHTPITKI